MESDRWATKTEIKKQLTLHNPGSAAGPVLYSEQGLNWVYTGEGHTIYLGVTGSGKTSRGTIPLTRSFIESGESFVCLDPKVEIYLNTAAALNDEWETHIFDFRNIYRSETFNILMYPYQLYNTGDPNDRQKACDLDGELAWTLYPPVNGHDPFWPDSARSTFLGAVYALFECAIPEEVNLLSAFQLINKEAFNGSSSPIGFSGECAPLKSFLSTLDAKSMVPILQQDYASTDAETRGGIRSTFCQGLNPLILNEGLISALSGDGFQISSLDGEKKITIYMIFPDETEVYDKISVVFLNQLMHHYIKTTHDRYGGRLPRRVNFLIEEAGNIGKIPSLSKILAAGRSFVPFIFTRHSEFYWYIFPAKFQRCLNACTF